MASFTVITIPIMTLIAIGAAIYGGYYTYTKNHEVAVVTNDTPATHPTPSPAGEQTPSPSPANEPISSQFPAVAGIATIEPTPSRMPTPSPSPTGEPTPTPEAVSTDYAIEFIDIPNTVKSGESFTIKWQVTGPAGGDGENTRLTTTYNTSSSSGNSSARVNNDISTSFGSFTVPKTFSSKHSLGKAPGDVLIEVTARVEGKDLRRQHTIILTQ